MRRSENLPGIARTSPPGAASVRVQDDGPGGELGHPSNRPERGIGNLNSLAKSSLVRSTVVNP